MLPSVLDLADTECSGMYSLHQNLSLQTADAHQIAGLSCAVMVFDVALLALLAGTIIQRASYYLRRERKTESPDPFIQNDIDGNRSNSTKTGRTIDYTGGSITPPKGRATLIIPQGAVPQGKIYNVSVSVTENIDNEEYGIPREQKIISSLVDCSSTGSFNSHVRITLPCEPNHVTDHVKTYYRNNPSEPWKEIKKKRKISVNCLPDIYYTVEDDIATICTRHFTQFICTCDDRAPREMNLTGVLFAELDEVPQGDFRCKEVTFRIFVVESIGIIQDIFESLIEDQRGALLRTDLDIPMPVDKDVLATDLLMVEMSAGDGLHIMGSSRVAKEFYNLVACHCRGPWRIAAEFVVQETETSKIQEAFRYQLEFTVMQMAESVSKEQLTGKQAKPTKASKTGKSLPKTSKLYEPMQTTFTDVVRIDQLLEAKRKFRGALSRDTTSYAMPPTHRGPQHRPHLMKITESEEDGEGSRPERGSHSSRGSGKSQQKSEPSSSRRGGT